MYFARADFEERQEEDTQGEEGLIPQVSLCTRRNLLAQLQMKEVKRDAQELQDDAILDHEDGDAAYSMRKVRSR